MQRFVNDAEEQNRSRIYSQGRAVLFKHSETSASFRFAGLWAYEGDLHCRGCKMNFSLAGCHFCMQTKN